MQQIFNVVSHLAVALFIPLSTRRYYYYYMHSGIYCFNLFEIEIGNSERK